MYFNIGVCLTGVYALYAILPTFYNKYWNSKVLRETGRTGALFLTFDDGPHRKYTAELLDILAKYQIQATFFLVAKRAEQCPDLVDRMLSERHCIGLHSLEHKDAMLKGYRHTKEDFRQSMAIMTKHHWPVSFYRPPWGRTNLFTLHFAAKYHLKPVLWSIMAEDWNKHSTISSIENKLLARAKDGGIICLHDNGGAPEALEKTLMALDHVIPRLKEAGYHFFGLSS